MHVIAGEHMPCGKEVKRKLEQGEMIDYEGSETKALSDFKCKIYRDGKVAGSPDMLNRMARARSGLAMPIKVSTKLP